MSTSVACTTVQSIDIDNCQEEMVQSNNFISFALKNLRKNLFNTSVNERRKITLDEVSNHDTFNDCWIVLYDRVYDVTKFLNEHPGGRDIILEHGGQDATQAFRGHSKFSMMLLKEHEIGELPDKECIYRRGGCLKCDELPE